MIYIAIDGIDGSIKTSNRPYNCLLNQWSRVRSKALSLPPSTLHRMANVPAAESIHPSSCRSRFANIISIPPPQSGKHEKQTT